MATKATIHKATLQISDIDRNVYGDHFVTLARHPSETDERMIIRLLAFALNVPASNDRGALEFAKDMWDPDEPALWQKDLTGYIDHWIEVGQPDEKRLLRATSRVGRVSVYSFSTSTEVWWKGIESKLTRARNLTVWQIPAEQSQALAALAQRTMELQVTVQDGAIWVGDGERSIEVAPVRLYGDPVEEHPSR
ncbi:MAG: YaeQ family protein [Chthoniobacteraceae bacterium]